MRLITLYYDIVEVLELCDVVNGGSRTRLIYLHYQTPKCPQFVRASFRKPLSMIRLLSFSTQASIFLFLFASKFNAFIKILPCFLCGSVYNDALALILKVFFVYFIRLFRFTHCSRHSVILNTVASFSQTSLLLPYTTLSSYTYFLYL